MTTNMNLNDIVSIWDVNDNYRVQIGVGQFKDPSLVSIYEASGVENCIVVTIVFVVEVFE